MKGSWTKSEAGAVRWARQTHTRKSNAHLLGTHTHAVTRTQTHTLSSRQQGPVSDHDEAWMCSVVRANDLRHMSSPCGFKTKHCQERSALAGQPAPCSAVLCCALHAASDTIPSPRRNSSSSFHIVLFFAPTDCCRLRVCCSHLSGCRRFACEAREGAATPRRLSPFTLPTVGEAVWRARDRRKGGRGDTEEQNRKSGLCVLGKTKEGKVF